MVKIVVTILLLIHGLIHFMGFAKAYSFSNMEQFTKEISKPMGLAWLLTGVLFLITVVLYLLKNDFWSILAIIAVVLSQVLIVMFWQDAKYGTIANVIILIAAVLAWASSSFENSYEKDVAEALAVRPTQEELVTKEDLAQLPVPVQKYLTYVGVVNKPRVYNFSIVFEGQMRDQGKDWFSFTSEQYNFMEQPTRLFFMKAKVKGLPTTGYHAYQNENASMLIKLLSLFPVVHIDGQELYATETVTFFNDLCLFAPAALIDDRIRWEAIDDLSAKASFTTNGTTISAILYFNEQGQLVNFVSEDRIAVAKMQTFPFSTPVNDYQNINGYQLPTYGEAVWHYPDGKFVYGKLRVKTIRYNVQK